ncbi:MAG: succinate dehydrogenase assembly factor 2 [Minwuia sp.]|nr:succinate dehydrogenase assembly factor 2 [Minwuia sp.]
MSDEEARLAVRRKKMLYRSQYTGTKETDILLTRFAERHLPTFTDRQMDLYQQMLNAGDPEILAWVMGRRPVPAEFDNEVTQMLMQFKFYQTAS